MLKFIFNWIDVGSESIGDITNEEGFCEAVDKYVDRVIDNGRIGQLVEDLHEVLTENSDQFNRASVVGSHRFFLSSPNFEVLGSCDPTAMDKFVSAADFFAYINQSVGLEELIQQFITQSLSSTNNLLNANGNAIMKAFSVWSVEYIAAFSISGFGSSSKFSPDQLFSKNFIILSMLEAVLAGGSSDTDQTANKAALEKLLPEVFEKCLDARGAKLLSDFCLKYSTMYIHRRMRGQVLSLFSLTIYAVTMFDWIKRRLTETEKRLTVSLNHIQIDLRKQILIESVEGGTLDLYELLAKDNYVVCKYPKTNPQHICIDDIYSILMNIDKISARLRKRLHIYINLSAINRAVGLLNSIEKEISEVYGQELVTLLEGVRQICTESRKCHRLQLDIIKLEYCDSHYSPEMSKGNNRLLVVRERMTKLYNLLRAEKTSATETYMLSPRGQGSDVSIYETQVTSGIPHVDSTAELTEMEKELQEAATEHLKVFAEVIDEADGDVPRDLMNFESYMCIWISVLCYLEESCHICSEILKCWRVEEVPKAEPLEELAVTALDELLNVELKRSQLLREVVRYCDDELTSLRQVKRAASRDYNQTAKANEDDMSAVGTRLELWGELMDLNIAERDTVASLVRFLKIFRNHKRGFEDLIRKFMNVNEVGEDHPLFHLIELAESCLGELKEKVFEKRQLYISDLDVINKDVYRGCKGGYGSSSSRVDVGLGGKNDDAKCVTIVEPDMEGGGVRGTVEVIDIQDDEGMQVIGADSRGETGVAGARSTVENGGCSIDNNMILAEAHEEDSFAREGGSAPSLSGGEASIRVPDSIEDVTLMSTDCTSKDGTTKASKVKKVKRHRRTSKDTNVEGRTS